MSENLIEDKEIKNKLIKFYDKLIEFNNNYKIINQFNENEPIKEKEFEIEIELIKLQAKLIESGEILIKFIQEEIDKI